MSAALDALVIALYVKLDDLLGLRHGGRGARPKLTDTELICLAVAQVMLGMPNDRQFLTLARWRLAHISPSFCDRLRLLDSTPVPCGRSRETVKRLSSPGTAGYGCCASHSRWFWGVRLYLICATDGSRSAGTSGRQRR